MKKKDVALLLGPYYVPPDEDEQSSCQKNITVSSNSASSDGIFV